MEANKEHFKKTTLMQIFVPIVEMEFVTLIQEIVIVFQDS